jgi:hypothetical protein
VGNDLWVSIDWKAQAVSVTRRPVVVGQPTEELGDGVLIDRDPDGCIVGVEVLA